MITNLVATDVSTGMLTSLSATAETLGLADRVTTRQADAEELPFDDESFDLVLGHAVLHHIPDLAKAFSEYCKECVMDGKATKDLYTAFDTFVTAERDKKDGKVKSNGDQRNS